MYLTMKQRVRKEENSKSVIAILALPCYCTVNWFCVSGINHCDSYTCICSLVGSLNCAGGGGREQAEGNVCHTVKKF